MTFHDYSSKPGKALGLTVDAIDIFVALGTLFAVL